MRKPKDSQHQLVAQQIWDAVRSNDKKAVYRLIVNSEAHVNAVLEQASSSSSLTLAKVMLLQEPMGHGHSHSSGTERSSASLLNFGCGGEGMSLEDLDGCTLLHLACETADIGMLELLLQYGANANAVDSRGNMPLHRCIIKGKALNAKLLLSR